MEKLIKVRVSDGSILLSHDQETMNIFTMVILLLNPSERFSIWLWIHEDFCYQIVALNSIESIPGFRPANNFESSIKFLLFLTSDLLVWVKWRWEFLSKLKSHVEKFFSKNRFHQKVQNSRENRHRPIPRRLAWNKSELWKKILHRTLHHFNDES